MNTKTVCQRCGVPVLAGARFCANCGADVSSEQGEVATKRFSGATRAQLQQMLDRVRHATLGEYDILTELGRGGMATVYLAHDLHLDRKVAIKVMQPALLSGDDMIERFRLEARTAAGLSHPHIIPVYSVRVAEQLVYFVMKFVEGRPLDAILKELGPLPLPMAQSITTKVGEALGYAHRRGVVHRDIKPANLMIDTEGLPVVTDFGIAKVADTRGLTMTGAMIGTPTYMSPEQCAAGEITGASDQYSLGIVVHQMLTGRAPFEGESMVGLLYKHVHEVPPSVIASRPDCPPAISDAVSRMLAKDPALRFPTIEAAVEAIGSVSLAFDHPMRSQLIGLARRGENAAILKRVSTPRSPIPLHDNRGELARSDARSVAAALTPVFTPRPVGGALARRGPLIAFVFIAIVGIVLWNTPRGARDGRAGNAVDPSATAPLTATPPVLTPPTSPGAATESAGGAPGSVTAPAPTDAGGGAATGVTSIRIEQVPTTLIVGTEAQLRATSLDGAGQPVPARAPIWSTTSPELLSVSATGRVLARTPGIATVIARRDGVARTVTLEVVRARVASIALAAPSTPLQVGASSRLAVTASDETGRPFTGALQWRSADPRVATVVDGVISAVGAGATLVTATLDGREGSAMVRVLAPEPVVRDDPAVTPAVTSPSPARGDPPVVEPSVAINALFQRYARALESRQISEVRRVFPGISPEQETQVAQTLRQLERLRVDFQIGDLRVVGDEATAQVSGTYEFYSPENRRVERLPVRFVATLAKGIEGWQIRSIR